VRWVASARGCRERHPQERERGRRAREGRGGELRTGRWRDPPPRLGGSAGRPAMAGARRHSRSAETVQIPEGGACGHRAASPRIGY